MKGFKKMGDLHSDMYAHGAKMGFAKGGKVMGKMQTSSMDSMDHGVQPARTGITEQDKEAGGTPKLRPRYKKGGKAAAKNTDEKEDTKLIGKAIQKHEKTPKPRGHGMKKGGKPTHNSTPMFGKGGRSC
ncbi:MAG TPA: hypothetical protein VMW50_06000 [Dehalococcoidia bacterium]|jgi:hypothetical protein|nr:hypothetical protein [Dehalococcoidia bacterium]